METDFRSSADTETGICGTDINAAREAARNLVDKFFVFMSDNNLLFQFEVFGVSISLQYSFVQSQFKLLTLTLRK